MYPLRYLCLRFTDLHVGEKKVDDKEEKEIKRAWYDSCYSSFADALCSSR